MTVIESKTHQKKTFAWLFGEYEILDMEPIIYSLFNGNDKKQEGENAFYGVEVKILSSTGSTKI